MQHWVAKRILGGIAWACALPLVMMMTTFASGQDAMMDPPHPAPSLSPPTPQIANSLQQQPSRQVLSFQPGLSSKDYLRLMAEATSFDPDVRLATAGSSGPTLAGTTSETFAPTSSLPEESLATRPNLSTSVHSGVQKDLGPSSAGSQVPSPRFSLSYENVWLRRSGDEGTSWSSGGALGPIGEDQAAIFRIGWYSNPMERCEFAYTGSLVWHRSALHSQPTTSLLTPSGSEPDWFPSFQNSLQHEQGHTARLRSYELNKRWITDDLGNYFLGLNIIDYGEIYGLRSLDSDGSGLLGLSTSNLLAGLQGGLELWHPLSQRLALGGQGVIGLYGNFADGDWHVAVEDEVLLRRGDERFQTAAGFGLNAKGRYQFTSRLYAYGSYRWWYLAGMATVDDQTIGPLALDTPFGLSTDAGFLIHGATCGLEFVF
jgi:hypothetical protein